METNLNEVETKVYEECKRVAKFGDNGSEFLIDDLELSISRKQLKGYLSQLVQKGYIEKFDQCYYDFGVIEFYEK